jgi:hypothetical protein
MEVSRVNDPREERDTKKEAIPTITTLKNGEI